MPMRNVVGYTPQYGAQIEKPELCATCHTLYTNPFDENGNPITDENGNLINFPEQTAYIEWENSIYGDGLNGDDKSCQTCHMPKANGNVKISNRPRNLTERQNFGKHYFVGGNVFMLSILKNNINILNLTAEKVHFDKTIMRTKNLLKSSAEIKIGTIKNNSGILEIPITIINRSGHKLPTGYPSRRVWIHLTVKDANGNIVFESGRVEPDGKIVGNDADENIAKYEPHYDIIDSEDKVQIYESIMEDQNGNITYTLLRATDYKKDNRLLPQGFNKTKATYDIAIKGNAKNDESFIGGQDTIKYKVNTIGYLAPFTITAELKFQSISYRFFKDLVKDRENSNYVSLFEQLYLQEDNSGYLISKDQKQYL